MNDVSWVDKNGLTRTRPGSFAAGVYALAHFGRLYRSNHSIVRLFFLHIQAIYNSVNLLMAWFGASHLFSHVDWSDKRSQGLPTTFSRSTVSCAIKTSRRRLNRIAVITSIVIDSLRQPNEIPGADDVTKKCWSGSFLQDDNGDKFNWAGLVNWIFIVICELEPLGPVGLPGANARHTDLAFLALQVILALGNRPKAERGLYTLTMSVYAFFSVYLIFMTVILTVKAFCPIGSILAASGGSAVSVFTSSTYGPIIAGLIGTLGVYLLGSILYLDPWHLLTSMPAYLMIAPSFQNVLGIYAFCNL